MADEDRDLLGDFTFQDEQRLLERRAALLGEARELVQKNEWDAQDNEKWERIDADVERLSNQIDAGRRVRNANRADAQVVQERAERTGTPAERHAEVFDKYMRFGVNKMSDDEIAILERSVDPQMRATVLNTTQGAYGGFLVPDGFWNRLVEAQKAYGPIEQYVNQITTSTGNDLPWLTEDSTSDEGEILNEGDTVSSTDMTFGVKVMRAYTYSSKLMKVSWQLLQDSAIDIEGLIARKAGIRLGRIHARHFTVGTGINQPEGIATGLSGGVPFAGATAITTDELIDLQHVLDPAYRTGTQRWMFNDNTLKLLRKLKDSDGNYVWQPGMVQGAPDVILGDPYIVNQAMPDPTSGNVSVLYGDFTRGYIIRRVKGATAVRLSEKYAEQLQTGYFVYDRMDGVKDETAAYTYGVQA